jgi:hypothetical protein
MNITCDFPGGNIVVEQIDGDTVRLHPDLRDTEGTWFYWHFRVSGAGGRTLHFEFTQNPVIGARGPAVSTDGGLTWNWLGAGESSRFSYRFSNNMNPVSFCMTIPYTTEEWSRFLSGHTNNKHLRRETLCVSRKGRPVEMLTCGCINETPKNRVLIVARHHCCETLQSFALEGLIDYMLGDEPGAAWMRSNVELLAIPFMDKDGVEDGDQGKNRMPRDHNRDYDEHGIYPEPTALISVGLDLHCPWISGGINECVYFVGLPSEEKWAEQQTFSRILEKTKQGPLPFRASNNLPYGSGWNVAASYQKGRSFSRWLCTVPGIRLSTTVELPYANAEGIEVNANSARAFGTDLGRAIYGYLK